MLIPDSEGTWTSSGYAVLGFGDCRAYSHCMVLIAVPAMMVAAGKEGGMGRAKERASYEARRYVCVECLCLCSVGKANEALGTATSQNEEAE